MVWIWWLKFKSPNEKFLTFPLDSVCYCLERMTPIFKRIWYYYSIYVLTYKIFDYLSYCLLCWWFDIQYKYLPNIFTYLKFDCPKCSLPINFAMVILLLVLVKDVQVSIHWSSFWWRKRFLRVKKRLPFLELLVLLGHVYNDTKTEP